MPAFNPGLVPAIPPGRLFTRFTTDETLNIRWLVAQDPVYFESLNRPIADEVLRTLVIAKAVDTLSNSLGHQTLYPFLVQPSVGAGVDQAYLPLNWIWDISIAVPKKWENLRLARIKRISGFNQVSGGSTGQTVNYTGQLRLLFTANLAGSALETILLIGDYIINSALTFQLVTLRTPNPGEEINGLSTDQSSTVAGYICFQTLDATQIAVAQFYELLAPPVPGTEGPGGIYLTPATYDIVDSLSFGTGSESNFSFTAIAHGTGLLTDSAWSPLPSLNADLQTWIESSNYPFDISAGRISNEGIELLPGLFREFNICAPAGDEPSGDTSGLYFPVWISRIELVAPGQLRWFFSTHNATETEVGFPHDPTLVEFASMDLFSNNLPGDIVAIAPADNLILQTGSNAALANQHFGRGHVVLSSVWADSDKISDFFSYFSDLAGSPQDTTFTQSSTRISSFGISRVPKYTPTAGQARAMLGSTSRLAQPISPGQNNRFVCEQDVGLGNQIDLQAIPGITPHPAIARFGFTGSLVQKTFILEIDASQLGSDTSFYQNQILPRIRALLGRDPQFNDCWFDGTLFKRMNTSGSWQG